MKLLVPSGTSLHDSCGEVSPAALTWSSFSGWPSVTSSLVTVNARHRGEELVGIGVDRAFEAHVARG